MSALTDWELAHDRGIPPEPQPRRSPLPPAGSLAARLRDLRKAVVGREWIVRELRFLGEDDLADALAIRVSVFRDAASRVAAEIDAAETREAAE